jgi:hypothetical protein
MKTMVQRPDDSPSPGLARDRLPGQRHDRSAARSRTAVFALRGNPHPQTKTCRRS